MEVMQPLTSGGFMAATITVAELDKLIRDVPEGAGTKRIKVADRLFVEVRRPGSGAAKCSFVLRYTHGRKKQSLGLGTYASKGAGLSGVGVSLGNAVKAAEAKLALIDKGIQPVKAAKAQAAKEVASLNARMELESRNLRKAAVLWHEDTKGKLTSDKYSAQRWRRLEEWLDLIGHKPVTELSTADVSDALAKLRAKTPGMQRMDTLQKSSSDLEKAFSFAIRKGWFGGAMVPGNPVSIAKMDMVKPASIPRRAFDVSRLPEFAVALDKVDAEVPYPVTAHLVRLLTLTAARTGEIRGLN